VFVVGGAWSVVSAKVRLKAFFSRRIDAFSVPNSMNRCGVGGLARDEFLFLPSGPFLSLPCWCAWLREAVAVAPLGINE
jgi:hypothetical protein